MAYNPRRSVPSIGKESTYGTEATMDKFIGLINPIEPISKKILLRRDGIRDDIEVTGHDVAYKDFKFEFKTMATTTWRILEYVFGDNQESEAGGIYTHTIAPLINSIHPAFSLEVAEKETPNEVITSLGTMIDEWTMQWQRGGYVEQLNRVVAQDIGYDSTISGSAAEPGTPNYFLARMIDLKIDTVTLPHDSGSLSVRKNLLAETELDGTNSQLITQPLVQEMTYLLTILRKKKTARANTAFSSATVDVVLKVEQGTNNYAEFTFNDAIVDEIGEPIDLGNGVVMERYSITPRSCTVEVKDSESWT